MGRTLPKPLIQALIHLKPRPRPGLEIAPAEAHCLFGRYSGYVSQ